MDHLRSAFQVINAMVTDGIIRKYAITGAMAALNYIEPTVSLDLDVLVSLDDFQSPASGIITLEPLLSYLRDRGYTKVENEGVVIEGLPVQFLPVANDLDAEGLDQAVEVEIEPTGGAPPIKVMTLSAPHLVATALKVGRPKDRERILRFIEEKAVDLKALRDVLRRHNLFQAWSKFCAQMGLTDLDEPPGT